MAEGNRTVFPFQYRWLMPFVCKTSVLRWTAVTDICLLSLLPLMGFILYLLGASPVACIAGAASVIGLAGAFSFNRVFPVLVDAPAMALMLVAYVFFLLGWTEAFIAVSVLSGCVKESAPLYLLGLTLNPLAAIGFVSPVIMGLFFRGGDNPESVKGFPGIGVPWSYTFGFRNWRNVQQLVLSWGGLLAAALFPSTQLLASLFLGYAPLVKVTNTVRVIQWAFPAVIIAVFTNVPDYACIPLALATIFNPYRTNGT